MVAYEERTLPIARARQLPPAESSATHRDYPRDRCVPHLVGDQAARTPDAMAGSDEREALTYRALDRRANQLARLLQGLGIGPEVRVGLCLERSVALAVGALGILKAGGAYVPLDPTYPPDRLDFMLRDAEVPVLVAQRSLGAQLPDGPWRTVFLDADAGTIARESAEPVESGVTATNLAYVIYTSGSTGRPKGVEIAHDSLLNLVYWHRRAFALTAADRATQIASPAFDAAVWELWPALSAGASVAFPDEATRLAPALLRDWLVARGITITFLPTPLAERIIALPWPATTALRIMLTGGDALHVYPPASLPFALVNNYGPTEGTVVSTSARVLPNAAPEGPPPIGWPIDNTAAYVLDEDQRPVPLGEPGELCIGGASLARGYLHRPDLTAAKFVPDPFAAKPGGRLYRTGDLVRHLPDGQLAFMGRIDGQVKIRGYRIEPDEIATVLGQHPAVLTGVVAAREDLPGEKRLVAYVVPDTAAAPTADDLRAFLADQLPDYMVPAAFVRLDTLPLTPNGKIDRAALPAPDAANTAWESAYVAPRTPLEEQLAAIVAALLGLERVGVEDNFFLLGGHSLLGTQVIARVRDTFGVDLPLRTLFDGPTVAELAAAVETDLLARLDALSDDEIAALMTE